MRYLLDTHTLIWFLADDNRLSESIKLSIENTNNEIFISIASLWEIGIKHSLNKLNLKHNLTEFFSTIQLSTFNILQITTNDILQLTSLHLHHRDPFDRLLIAQAMVAHLTIITKDQAFSGYDVNLKWD